MKDQLNKELAHTPGPWTYSPMKGKAGHCFCAQVWDNEGLNLLSIESKYGEQMASANAKIIAAAPELLECLFELMHEDVKAPISLMSERLRKRIHSAVENAITPIADV